MSHANVVSFSGGRTSAYLVSLMKRMQDRGEIDNLHFVFMDTGAEHPGTYNFIKKCVDYFEIELTCLRTIVSLEKGVGIKYKVIDLDECKYDLKPFADISRKYSTPYLRGAHCTQHMKTYPFQKWCKDQFGKDYTTWLGIRIDEGQRLKERPGYRYLAEISSMEKLDIIGWWREMPFDLEIPEYLGNCVFCLKKGTNKIELARRAEPELGKAFHEMLKTPEFPVLPSKILPNEYIFRQHNSLETIEAMYADVSTDQIIASLRSSSGACTESCEVFGCQVDMFNDLGEA